MRKNTLKFPGKNEEGREDLESVIKKEDKWQEVSTLDPFALTKVVSTKSWPAKLLDKILSFGRILDSLEKINCQKIIAIRTGRSCLEYAKTKHAKVFECIQDSKRQFSFVKAYSEKEKF